MKTYILYNKLAHNLGGEAAAKKAAENWKNQDQEFRNVLELKDYQAFLAGLAPEDELLLCGGDGTLNHFVNDVDGLELKNDLYFCPTGTGNDFWRDLDKGPEDGPCKINAYLKNLPTVTVNGMTRKFINGVGYGIDGYCCEVADKLRESSDKPINYTGIAVKGLLFHYQPTTAAVEVDGKKTVYEKTWLAPTMYGRYYGGGMMAAPEQKRLQKDPRVTVMVMQGAGRIRTLIAFPKIFKGEHVKNRMTHTLTGKKVRVSFDRPVALQIDGETVLNVREYSVSF